MITACIWIVVGGIYMETTGNWSSGLLPFGWAMLAAGWFWIGVGALRSTVSATA